MARTTHLVKRNFVLGVINGAVYRVMMALMDPTLIVAAFVLHAMGDTHMPLIWIAVVTSAVQCGWSWPSVFLSHILESRPRKMPYYRLSAAIRLCCLAGIIGVVRMIGDRHPVATVVFLAASLFVYSSAGGIGIIPFFDTVSRSMPGHYLGRFFGMRMFFGGILGFGGGVLARYILDEKHGYTFPENYVVLFTIAFAAAVASLSAFSLCKDPRTVAHKRRVGFVHHLRRIPRILRRNSNFRTFLLMRMFLSIATLTVPFYLPFAVARLRATEPMVGLFSAIVMLSGVVSNLLWSYVSDTQGNRRVLLLSATLWMIVQASALSCTRLSAEPTHTWFGLDFSPQLTLMSLTFFLSGFSLPGRMMGEMNLILEMSPERRRPTYLGIMYLLLFPLAFLPIVGAVLIGTAERFELGFLIALAFGALGLLTALRLRDPRLEGAESPPRAEGIPTMR